MVNGFLDLQGIIFSCSQLTIDPAIRASHFAVTTFSGSYKNGKHLHTNCTLVQAPP